MTRILVVEDEDTIRNNLATLLRFEGYEVLLAENGKEALAIINQDHPDLVLSDLMMPVMDGHDLLAAIRKDPLTNSMPLIFLTAKGGRTDVREGMNLGADDYVTKPFHRDEVLNAISARLRRVEAQRVSIEHLQSEARRLIHYDALTCLPNRAWLTTRLAAAMAHSRRSRSRLAVLMIGLDGFGRINDAFGRDAGDGVLREVAGRLQARVSGAPLAGSFDSIARVSGDEFVIVIEGFGSVDYLGTYTLGLITDVARPIQIADSTIFVSACAGITVWEMDSEIEGDALVQQAETALRQAKSSGPGSRVFYSEDISKVLSRRMLIHNELHHALADNQLSLHYQPQFDIKTGAIVGCEALMRWQHPSLGFVSPAEFIPIAEEGGMIPSMGGWALETACAQARQWCDAGLPIRVAVNLSAKQVCRDDILGVVSDAMRRVDLPPELLELEITESVAMQDVEIVIVTLSALKSLGIALAMDDFGTGYSSLAYLKRLPLDILKVDQSFVRNATTDPGDAAITRAVIAMAHSFDMSVVAEGVETQDHLGFLANLGCEVAQGYLFSKPLPADAATAFFRQRLKL